MVLEHKAILNKDLLVANRFVFVIEETVCAITPLVDALLWFL